MPHDDLNHPKETQKTKRPMKPRRILCHPRTRRTRITKRPTNKKKKGKKKTNHNHDAETDADDADANSNT